jgi:hypothetical protein
MAAGAGTLLAGSGRDLQRGWQARPGPCSRWCFTRLSRRPHCSQAGCPSESTRALAPDVARESPVHSNAQLIGELTEHGFGLDSVGHRCASPLCQRWDLVGLQGPPAEDRPARPQQQRPRPPPWWRTVCEGCCVCWDAQDGVRGSAHWLRTGPEGVRHCAAANAPNRFGRRPRRVNPRSCAVPQRHNYPQ